MEARFGSEVHHIYGLSANDMRAVGKRSLEWDLNDWKWDGDLFIANPLNPRPSCSNRQFFPLNSGIPAAGNASNSSPSCSDEVNLGIENAKRELEKRRRVIVIEDDDNNGELGRLSLKLGGNGFPVREREMGNWDGNSSKKTKVAGGNGSCAVCQVEDCGADLSKAKDYHRRHKVCEMHSKATKALVGNVMQRFCQQCSRFHVLEEFDEGKRSCRRRLAGHNKRRRKTNPGTAGNGTSLNDDQSSGYLLISLLRILSNMHSNKSDQVTDQDLLAHLLKSLAKPAAEQGVRNVPGLLQEPRALPSEGAAFRNSEQVVRDSNGMNLQTSSLAKPIIPNNCSAYSEARDTSSGQVKMNNFDLNDIYIDSDDSTEDIERSPVPATVGTSSLDCPLWVQQDSHQSSPPQTSGNSDSASAQSPSSSNGDTQSRTDRIIVKLFGKEPSDFPLILRAQVLDWLANSPTEIESYIRPGCVVLTVYLRQAEAAWDELCCDLGSSLSRLLDVTDDSFWSTGWVYIRAQHQIAFVSNGRVVVDTSLPLRSNNYSKILSITPVAISTSERVQFSVKGINLSRPATRLLCAVEGSYMVQENTNEMEETDSTKGRDELRCVKFTCSIPTLSGRGFVEIEDHGFSSSFFPFIVAEEDVCSEIRMLEGALEITERDEDLLGTGKSDAKNQAMDFIHEMGWLLHRRQLKSRLGHLDPNTEVFSFRRFRWLMDFSLDREWGAVVNKLLDILHSGIVGTGEHLSIKLALSEMGILHRAVRKNSRSLVERLLRFVPQKTDSSNKAVATETSGAFLFRPDVAGPAGLTPLHIAAGKDGSEDVLDALTDDPEMVGLEAWKKARDSTGATPEDYARLRGHYAYIHLVQKKINKRPATGHVVVDIPTAVQDPDTNKKQIQGVSLEIAQALSGGSKSRCGRCSQKVQYGTASRGLVYRPAMLSMVAVAAVCVCVALLFKSCPEVVYVFRPFRWELLEYGTS